jgi:hypothetical protein
MRRILGEALGLRGDTGRAELCIPEVRFISRDDNDPAPFFVVVVLTGLSMRDCADGIQVLNFQQARRDMERRFAERIAELMPTGHRSCDLTELAVTFDTEHDIIKGSTLIIEGTADRRVRV